MTYRMKQKVYIVGQPKTDGRVNEGIIVGIELSPDAWYLGYWTKQDFYSKFTSARYKVAYQDCFTEKFCQEWYSEKDLSIKKTPA